jgi:hypothetical protein
MRLIDMELSYLHQDGGHLTNELQPIVPGTDRLGLELLAEA